MTADTRNRRDYGFMMGFVTGTAIGAGVALWLAPRMAAEIGQRVTDTARDLTGRASEQYEQVKQSAAETLADVTAKGRVVRDGIADAVARGAREVERAASDTRTNSSTDAKAVAVAD